MRARTPWSSQVYSLYLSPNLLAVVEGMPEWPKFVPGEVDGALQLGGLGPDSVATYVPLRQEDRALYTFMDERYFGASGRMGKILGPLLAASEPQPSM